MSCCDGFLLVDKPAGPTSFAVVDQVRRALVRVQPELQPRRQRGARRGSGRRRFRCGHAGSLDPLATGLLILMCGSGTRLSPFLMGLDKCYAAVVRFGVGTDSHDVQGEVTERRPVAAGPAELAANLASFRGVVQQVPPVISALKRGGKRLYKLARSGAEIPPLEPKEVQIHSLEVVDTRWGVAPAESDLAAADGLVYEASLVLECSSGTYVRSLARDLAATLETVGHVFSLRRLAAGPFRVEDALAADRLDDGEELRAAVRPLGEALPHLPALTLSPVEAGRLRRGDQPAIGWLQRLDRPLGESGGDEFFQMKDRAGRLVAVGKLPAAGGLPRSAAVFPAAGEETDRCD